MSLFTIALLQKMLAARSKSTFSFTSRAFQLERILPFAELVLQEPGARA